MKITSESDYALRILRCLGQAGTLIGSKTIAENIAVPERYTLKILRKLMISGMVTSKQGPGGGYELCVDPAKLTILDVVEAVDGPILVNRCLEDENDCSRAERNGTTPADCYFHCFMARVNEEIRARLASATIAEAIAFEENKPGSTVDIIFGRDETPVIEPIPISDAQAIRHANIL